MKMLFPIFACFACLAGTLGCTTFHVKQVDESPEERTITTEVTGTAWFSSAQHLTKFKALSTDKTQSVGTESFGQQGATNTVEALKALADILKLIRPLP